DVGAAEVEERRDRGTGPQLVDYDADNGWPAAGLRRHERDIDVHGAHDAALSAKDGQSSGKYLPCNLSQERRSGRRRRTRRLPPSSTSSSYAPFTTSCPLLAPP